MSNIPAVITGIGPVSAIGAGRDAFWSALIDGTPGFGPITLCDASKSPSRIAAEIRDFDLERYVDHGGILGRRTPRPVQLALAASVLALHDAEIDLDACDANRLGVHVGTSVGNIADVLALNDRYDQTGVVPPHAAFHAFNHSAACVISSFFNIRGPIHTTTSGCNSGIDALGQSLRLIQSGAVDAMLVIGTDCEVVPEILAALNASHSLTTKYNDDPARASRPFDRGRDGNVIGEGAAALLLEAEPHARARDARIYARLAGYQVCAAGQNRQYSHDRPDLDLRPCVRALRGAIADARWTPDTVNVVNANGSSSVIYDRLEALALAEALGPALAKTRVHSIKSMLGQHGAGSSALQAVTACLSIRRGAVPPTINHDDPDPACGALPVATNVEMLWPQRVLVHAIGLGGFYYSAAAFEMVSADSGKSGLQQVKWSDLQNPKFMPKEEYQKPLRPWLPRSDGST
jgi:3-oxoacyl-[acyl-carrier-protein] synthase II